MTARIFVACTPAERLPMQVLEFSIRETSSVPVEVRALHDFERAQAIPRPRDLRNQPRTPFSFQRFLIPQLCGHAGRAIYLDADMQVFQDIASLWNAPMQGHDLLTVQRGDTARKGQFSVMLLDCERLGWDIEKIVAALDAGQFTYEQLMLEMCVAQRIGHTLSPAWNSLERYAPGETCLLHYTDMDTQPWVSLDNPLGHLWIDCLRRAAQAGALSIADVERAAALGHVRPSLPAQLRDPGARTSELRRLDRAFVAPYKSIRSGRASPFLTWRAALSAYGRRGLQRLRAIAGG